MSMQSLGGGVEIKVTPEVLKEIAGEATIQIQKLEECFGELERIIQGTRSYWIGEAGDLHRQAYTDKKSDVDEIIRRLKEHPVDLLQISGNFEEAERTILDQVNALNPNAIF